MLEFYIFENKIEVGQLHAEISTNHKMPLLPVFLYGFVAIWTDLADLVYVAHNCCIRSVATYSGRIKIHKLAGQIF